VSVTPAAISAVAATIAAILAAVNVYLIRRNENVKWARETLVETFTQFLGASFEGKNAVKAAARAALNDPGSPEIEQLRAEARRIEKDMRDLQTRMRLLTNPAVVEAAQALRYSVRDYIAFLDDLSAVSPETDKALRTELWRRREEFVAAVKKTLSL
jgi:hypothetical protein